MSTDNKTLADAQHGGRVRLGDGVRCSKCEGRGYFNVDVDVDDSGGSIGNIEACPHCTLSAQPSPGGQWAPEIEQLHKLVSSILSTVSLGYQTGPYAYAGEDFGGYLHEAASNCRTILRGLSNIAARQPVRIYGCCAQPEGELHTAECPNMRHLAAGQPVGEPYGWVITGPNGSIFCPADRQDIMEATTRSELVSFVEVYAAPPAQAVDLGQFRASVLHAYEEMHDGYHSEKLGSLLALIDSLGAVKS